MGREFIGECSTLAEGSQFDHYEDELVIKFIKQESGEPPRGAEVQVTREDHELGSYPVISVVWDDGETGYPEDYIQKCVEAFERFELPEEIREEGRESSDFLREINADMEKWFETD